MVGNQTGQGAVDLIGHPALIQPAQDDLLEISIFGLQVSLAFCLNFRYSLAKAGNPRHVFRTSPPLQFLVAAVNPVWQTDPVSFIQEAQEFRPVDLVG